jgi:hypothetical protein
VQHSYDHGTACVSTLEDHICHGAMIDIERNLMLCRAKSQDLAHPIPIRSDQPKVEKYKIHIKCVCAAFVRSCVYTYVRLGVCKCKCASVRVRVFRCECACVYAHACCVCKLQAKILLLLNKLIK